MMQPYLKRTIVCLDDYLEAIDNYFKACYEFGVVCLKNWSAYRRSLAYGNPTKAEAEKEAAILRAAGQAEAIRTVQQALADSLAMLNEKAPNDQVIKLKSIEGMQRIADGNATKIIIPSEIQGLVGLANGIVEGTKQ